MTKADDPNLADLKKLLRRLEKIDPDSETAATAAASGQPADNARKLEQALLDKAGNEDGLLALAQRPSKSGSGSIETPDLPVIVKRAMPVPSRKSASGDAGTVRTVVIASVTAALVSAIAAAATVYWLSLGTTSQLAEFTADPMESQSSLSPGKSSGPGSPQAPQPITATAGAAGTSLAAAPAAAIADSDDAAAKAVGSPSDAAAEDPPTGPGGGEAAIDAKATAQSSPQSEIEPPQPQLASTPGGDASANGAAAATPPETAEQPLPQPSEPPVVVAAARELAATLGPGNAQAAQPAVTEAGSVRFVAATVTPTIVATELDRESTTAETADPQPDARQVTVFEAKTPDETGAQSQPSEEIAEPTREPPPSFGDSPQSTAGQELERAVAASPPDADQRIAALQESEPPSQPPTPAQAADGNSLNTTPPDLSALPIGLRRPGMQQIQADADEPLQLEVTGPPADLEGHYLILSGLKRGARLSAGIELMFDTWRVSLSELRGLTVRSPDGFAQRMHVDAELRKPDGTVRETTTLVLSQAGLAGELAPDEEERGDLPEAVRRHVDEAGVQVDNGNLAGARLLYSRAAAAGSARAALLLGASYDPSSIAGFKTSTPPAADVGLARRWYARAQELGAASARAKLEALR